MKSIVCVNIVLCCFVLVCFEIYLRRTHQELGNAHKTYVTSFHREYHHWIEPLRRRAYTIDGHKYEQISNSWGMNQQAEPVVPKPKGLYRLLVVGDSFVHGYGTNSIPNHLQVMINEECRWPVEVINGGTLSYSPLLHIARFRNQFYRLEPDGVLFLPDPQDYVNDYEIYRERCELDSVGKVLYVRSDPSHYLGFLAKYRYDQIPSHLYKLILKTIGEKRAVREAKSSKKVEPRIPALERTSYNRKMIAYSVEMIDEYIGLLREHGVHVAVAAIPPRGAIDRRT